MIDEAIYYSRQMRLKEVGVEGQKKLSEARCLVIGAGGLGSSALPYLTAAGIGTLGICDFDRLDASNLHRQPLYSCEEIGQMKAVLAAQRLKQLNPFINIRSHPIRFSPDQAENILNSYDLILDCTDNFSSKFLINDAAFFFKKPLIRASIYQFEGQLQVYLPQRRDACLRCLWGKMPPEGCVGSCQEVGVIGPLPGYFGLLQAMETIKYFLGLPILKENELLLIDLLTHSQKKVSYFPSSNCPLCGSQPSITALDCDLNELVAERLDRQILKQFILIDLREKQEIELDPFVHAPHFCLPMSSFTTESLESGKQYLFFCHKGNRSAHLVSALKREGINRVFSMTGGKKALDYVFENK